MRSTIASRLVVAVSVGALALLGFSSLSSAQPGQDQRQQEKDRQQQEKDKQQGRGAQKHLSQQEQQRLIAQQQQRLAQYNDHLNQQQRAGQQHSAQLQSQNRKAQASYQQQYVVSLQQQQVRVQAQGRYNYNGDPYFSTPVSLRYQRGGRYYETNQYGADQLRLAVNNGYDQGVRAGQADRQDRWASNYGASYAYQDANYGYSGFYIERADYNNYFREGFRRGYADGYNGRYQSGTYVNGHGSVLGAVLATIINFTSIR